MGNNNSSFFQENIYNEEVGCFACQGKKKSERTNENGTEEYSMTAPQPPSSTSVTDPKPSSPVSPEPLEEDQTENSEPTEVMEVLSADLKLNENGIAHHTKNYDIMNRKEDPQLVVRRGQAFLLDIQFSRPYSSGADEVAFCFKLAGSTPSVESGTAATFLLTTATNSTMNSKKWHASIQHTNGDKVCIKIKTPAKCPVGKWKVAVSTKLKKAAGNRPLNPTTVNLKKSIFVLFNAWNAEDGVYLKGDEARKEYILRDTGMIWTGSHNNHAPRLWAYSQFELNILSLAVDLLGKHLKPAERGDAVKTARALSALINAPDDNGILVGKWGGDFSDGTEPTKWTGSAKILQKYHEKRQPVRYGQCWVFAGVLTTVCRAIGIPARPVTNFSSGHDRKEMSASGHSFSLTIDKYVDEMGKPVEEMNEDSVWNFHVWTEVFMKREDLGPEYGGWQAIDATPQERSNGVFCLGPASLEACRRGEITSKYDVDFLYGEVNADRVYWLVDSSTNKPPKLLSTKLDRSGIGLKISTKAMGKDAREDVTLKYKHPEGSKEEREAMLAALKKSGNPTSAALHAGLQNINPSTKPKPISFEFGLLDAIVMGSSVRAVLIITNTTETEEFDVKGVIRVDSKLYTGDFVGNIDIIKFDHKLQPKEKKQVILEVTYEEYSKHVTSKGALNLTVLAHVEQTDFHYFEEFFYGIKKPDIQFKVVKEDGIYVGEPMKFTVFFTNPLPVPLQNSTFRIEAPGLGDISKFKIKGVIQPGQTASAEFEYTPKVNGKRTLIAKFESLELGDVNGYVTVKVNRSENDVLS